MTHSQPNHGAVGARSIEALRPYGLLGCDTAGAMPDAGLAQPVLMAGPGATAVGVRRAGVSGPAAAAFSRFI